MHRLMTGSFLKFQIMVTGRNYPKIACLVTQ